MRSGHFTCQGAEGLRLGGSAWQRGAGLCGKGAEQGSRPSAGSGLCERDVFAAEFVCDLEPASISGHCPFPSFLNFSVPELRAGREAGAALPSSASSASLLPRAGSGRQGPRVPLPNPSALISNYRSPTRVKWSLGHFGAICVFREVLSALISLFW